MNPKAIVPSTDLTALQLGRGDILDDFDYISTEYGSKHQHGITHSDSSIYFFDIIRKKFMAYTVGSSITPLSEISGLSAFFANNFNNSIQIRDNPIEGEGISCTYDYRFFEALFTFHDKIEETPLKYTVAYNELLKAFTSFYSFTTGLYINDKRIILTPDQTIPVSSGDNKFKDIYIHNKGNYGKFYNKAPDESFVTLMINPEPTQTKVFTNIEFQSECFDQNGQDVSDETITQGRVNFCGVGGDSTLDHITITCGFNIPIGYGLFMSTFV